MIETIVNLASLAVVAVLVLWVAWYVVKRYWPTTATSSAGLVIEQVADVTQGWSAKAALRMIRWMDEVDQNPEVLAAWDTLYKAVGGRDNPQPTSGVIPEVAWIAVVPQNATEDPHASKVVL